MAQEGCPVSDDEIVTNEEMVGLFNMPLEIQGKAGFQTMRSESLASDPLSRTSLVRGHVCDMSYIDVHDCDGDSPVDQTIRQIRMLKAFSGE